MQAEEMRQLWQARSEEAFGEVARWREAHPKATLAQIEQMIDDRLSGLRAQMIEDVAQASSPEQSRRCPQCGASLQGRGHHQRVLQTQGGQEVNLSRQYLSCPHCGYSFFPPG